VTQTGEQRTPGHLGHHTSRGDETMRGTEVERGEKDGGASRGATRRAPRRNAPQANSREDPPRRPHREAATGHRGGHSGPGMQDEHRSHRSGT